MADLRGGAIRTAEPVADAPVAAALHARAFAGRERSWSAGEISGLAAAPGGFLLLAEAKGAPAALLLGRVAAGEAELLTLGADPAARRVGLGRALLAAFAERARHGGAAQAFLEVAADNAAARALYAGAGWREAGLRRNYVHRLDGSRCDALVLALDLG